VFVNPLIFALALTILVSFLPCRAEENKAAGGPGSVFEQFLSNEPRPGKGSLDFKKGKQTERIELTSETGRYAVGIAFQPTVLPEHLRREFKDHDIIQIALGTLPSKLAGHIPVFGTFTVMTPGLPRKKLHFSLSMFNAPRSTNAVGITGRAFLLFSSPFTKLEQPDEEKLKGTYFAKSGTLSLTPVGSSQKLELKHQGKTYHFSSQSVLAELEAAMATPFNAEETSLRGQVALPLYWPADSSAKELTKRLASESLSKTGSIPAPPGLSERNSK
jgi:hypothetical protein